MNKKKEPKAFSPEWPEGLAQNTRYRIFCDDDGRACDASLTVIVAEDGDVHVAMSAYHNDGLRARGEGRSAKDLNPFPTVRIRTYAGGGRNRRTRQALLWLADAIRRDNEENNPVDPGS